MHVLMGVDAEVNVIANAGRNELSDYKVLIQCLLSLSMQFELMNMKDRAIQRGCIPIASNPRCIELIANDLITGHWLPAIKKKNEPNKVISSRLKK